jgi:rubrerythrin
MPRKPSYLGLLNAIALGESRAHRYLTAWIEVTPNPAVRKVLATVAAREGEHGMAFAKRLNELGYGVLPREDAQFERRLQVAGSKRSDVEKFELLGLAELDTKGRPDIFDGMFADHSIDIRTGELLGRYIAEERDSARLLRRCYDQLRRAGAGSPSPSRPMVAATSAT